VFSSSWSSLTRWGGARQSGSFWVDFSGLDAPSVYLCQAFAWHKVYTLCRIPKIPGKPLDDPQETFMSEAFVYDAIRTPRGKGKKDGSLLEV
jgi:hypothetical protein